MVQLGDLEALVHMQRVVHVDELLQQLCLVALPDAVLLFPACGQFLVQSVYFILMFCYQVVYFNLNAVAPVLKELLPLTLGQPFDLLAHSIDFWVAIMRQERKIRFAQKQAGV